MSLEDIKGRLAAASPGPWALLGGGEYIEPIGITVAPDDGGVTSANAEFIAHAPEDIARLIAVAEAVEERLKWLDTLEQLHPTLPGKPNASAGGVASVLRKDIQEALEGGQ